MPTPVLGSLIFETIPTVSSTGVSGGDPLMVSDNNTIPAVVGAAGAPSGAPQYGTGELYVDTTNIVMYYWNGTTWTTFSAGSATNATNVGINTTATNATYFPTFVSATTGNLPLFVDTGLTFNPSTNTLTIGGALTLGGELTMATGTATLSPMVFTSGTLNTTAVDGAVEYNGQVLYFTPAASNRSLVVSPHFYRANAPTTMANSLAVQSLLGSGTLLTTGVTLQAGTVYEFEGEFAITFTTSAAHTESVGFKFTTLTANNILWAVTRYLANASVTAPSTIFSAVATGAPVSLGSFSVANITAVYSLKGTISVNAGGSLLPTITFGTAPGAAPTLVAGSWFKIYPIGPAGVISVGTWS